MNGYMVQADGNARNVAGRLEGMSSLSIGACKDAQERMRG
jgi:hypothetical protein